MGRVKVKVKLGGMLGDENEMVTKCQRGQIQAVGASTGALASQVPELHLVELPYLFRTFEEADNVIDNVLTPAYEGHFKKRGLILGFWSENGYRHFGTRDKVIKTLADLKGKKMRSQESPVHLAMYKAFGASAMPIPTTEVPQALATGNVDGFDQSALYALATSWTKSVKYFTVSEHIYQPAAIVYNAEWFGKLPPDLQKLVVDEGRALQVKGRKAVREIFPELLEIMKNDGIEVYTMTPGRAGPLRGRLQRGLGQVPQGSRQRGQQVARRRLGRHSKVPRRQMSTEQGRLARLDAAIYEIEKKFVGALMLVMGVVMFADVVHRVFSRAPGRLATMMAGLTGQPVEWVDRVVSPAVIGLFGLFIIYGAIRSPTSRDARPHGLVARHLGPDRRRRAGARVRTSGARRGGVGAVLLLVPVVVGRFDRRRDGHLFGAPPGPGDG
jgi:TRAP-type C4-dicarboxylate transport system substrate-binding protein